MLNRDGTCDKSCASLSGRDIRDRIASSQTHTSDTAALDAEVDHRSQAPPLGGVHFGFLEEFAQRQNAAEHLLVFASIREKSSVATTSARRSLFSRVTRYRRGARGDPRENRLTEVTATV